MWGSIVNGKRNKAAGFSLLEVMVAVAILAVSFLALMNLQGRSSLAAGRAQRIAVSTLLARQKMAEVLLEIEKGIPKGEFPDAREEEGLFEEEDFPDYFWRLEVKSVSLPVPAAPEGEAEIMVQVMGMLTEQLSKAAREVRLTVGWMEFEEEETALTVVTHIVNPQEI